jgi:hypothetical protein
MSGPLEAAAMGREVLHGVRRILGEALAKPENRRNLSSYQEGYHDGIDFCIKLLDNLIGDKPC